MAGATTAMAVPVGAPPGLSIFEVVRRGLAGGLCGSHRFGELWEDGRSPYIEERTKPKRGIVAMRDWLNRALAHSVASVSPVASGRKLSRRGRETLPKNRCSSGCDRHGVSARVDYSPWSPQSPN